MKQAACPYCGETISDEAVTLWDDRRYCRCCVEEVSPDLYEFAVDGGQLVDVVEKSDVRSLLFLINFGKMYLVFTFLFCFLFWGLLALIGIGKEEDLLSPWTLFAVFGGGGLILILLKSLILNFIKRFHFPRMISFEKGHLTVRYASQQKHFPLEKCKWYVGSTILSDLICLNTGLRQGIVFQTPEGLFACGQSPETLKHWCAFLTLTRTSRLPVPRSVFYIPFGSLGMVVGTLTGFSIGHVVAMMTEQERWIPGLLLLGAIDSLVIAVLYIYRNRFACEDDSRPFPAIVWALLFCVLGSIVGLIGDIPGAFFTGSLNAVIGLYAASGIQTQIPEPIKEVSIAGLK